MTTGIQVGLARMEEQMKTLVAESAEAKVSRKENYKKLEDIDKRLAAVEVQVASAAPTLAEFVVLKHKVEGAGILGKWLWLFGGALIGVVFTARESIKNWLIGN